MKALSGDDWKREYRHAKGTRAQIIRRFEKSQRDDIRSRERAVKVATKARLLFDDLRGAALWKDAKQDWQYDY